MILMIDLPKLFDGCFLVSERRISVPGRGILDRSRFNVIFGGNVFELPDNRTTTSPYVAFRAMLRVAR